MIVVAELQAILVPNRIPEKEFYLFIDFISERRRERANLHDVRMNADEEWFWGLEMEEVENEVAAELAPFERAENLAITAKIAKINRIGKASRYLLP